jgi:hypothetical protein
MRTGDIQIGKPSVLYKGTEAVIEALTGIVEGAIAYATDTDKLGIYDGSTWTWSSAIDSVNGQTGVVVLDAGDIGVTPIGDIYSDNVQAALEELDTEKATEANVVMDTDTAGGDLAGTYPNPEVAKASKTFALPSQISDTHSGTGTVDDYNPAGLADAVVIDITPDASYAITGIVGGVAGRILILNNLANFNINLLTIGDSSAENKFDVSAGGMLRPYSSIVLRYDSSISKWKGIARNRSLVYDADVYFQDNTSGNADSDAHGFMPKLSGVEGEYLDSDGVWTVPPAVFNDAEGDPAAIAKTAVDGTSVYPAHRDHVHTGEGTNITLPVVGTPDFNDMQDMHTIHHSSGLIDGDAVYISKIDETHIAVAAGQGVLRTTNDVNGDLVFIEWAAVASIEIPAGSSTVDVVRYIGIEYNAGSPQVTVRTSFDWNWYTDFPIGRVSQDGTTLRFINVYAHTEDTANLARRYNRLTMPYAREEPPEGSGGLEIGDKATRYITMTAGNIWHGFNRFILSALDTSGTDRFDLHYKNAGGGFTHVANQQQWPNTQYDDDSGTLADLTANRYSCLWVYLDVSDGTLDVLYGSSNAVGAANAQLETPPATIPGHLSAHGRLLGRIIFQKSASAAELVESAWTVAFHASAGALSFNDGEGDPADLGTVADGTSTYVARRDHVHSIATVIPVDGWVSAEEAWTYASASTFTVSGDVTAKYQKGTKLKWTQTTVQYGVIAGSVYSAPNTIVTILVNDDYVIDNAAISANYYSYIENPQSWPGWFNWTPTPTGHSAITTQIGTYTTHGNKITIFVNLSVTSNATTFTITNMPATNNGPFASTNPIGLTTDAGTIQTTPGRVSTAAASVTATLRKDSANGAWTNSGTKSVVFWTEYEF